MVSGLQLKKHCRKTYLLRIQELPLDYLVMYACASQSCFVAGVQMGVFVELRHEIKSEGGDLPGPVRKQVGHQL